MKKIFSKTIVTTLSFIFSISLISATAYAQEQQQQQQQQQDQAAPFITQNTSNSMQDLLSGNESSQTQFDIKRIGSQPSTKGPEDYFTGTMFIDTLFQANDPARATGGSGTFEPGARTAWHIHPFGQTLIVTAGCGLVQVWGNPAEKICQGDVVWIPPGLKHWHGATPTTTMTHTTIQEELEGKIANWMEKVSDEQYQGDSQILENGSSQTQKLDIKRIGSQPSAKGPAEYFTGTVRIDPLFQANDPARTAGASVTFEPGARSAWHTHPLGQILIVTAGCGLVQVWGSPVEKICPGDVVWIPPNEKHWHGATPTTAMTHIAIQEQLDGKVVDWMEKVSDEQYNKTKTHYQNLVK